MGVKLIKRRDGQTEYIISKTSEAWPIIKSNRRDIRPLLFSKLNGKRIAAWIPFDNILVNRQNIISVCKREETLQDRGNSLKAYFRLKGNLIASSLILSKKLKAIDELRTHSSTKQE